MNQSNPVKIFRYMDAVCFMLLKPSFVFAIVFKIVKVTL
uniref:Uncharacterized protein n=1 Tax=Methylophaga nitratireducenticrescens TaxID=754476 RepID=I1XHE2_METNJ